MRRKSGRLLSTVAGLAVLGFGVTFWPGEASTVSHAERQQAPDPPTLVAQPSTWQPFIASIRITRPDGPGIVVGTLYRRSDGSERNDTGPAGGTTQVISIRNHRTRGFYTWTATRGWRRHPLGFELTTPPKRIRKSGDAELYQPSAAIEGFEVLRTAAPDGSEAFVAPELNLYPLVLKTPGRTVELHDIRRVEPSDDLFLPPAGVQVVEMQNPVDGQALAKPRRR